MKIGNPDWNHTIPGIAIVSQSVIHLVEDIVTVTKNLMGEDNEEYNQVENMHNEMYNVWTISEENLI